MVIISSPAIKEILMEILQVKKKYPRKKYNQIGRNEEHQKE